MTRCDFRSRRECSCAAGECGQMKPMLDLRETPVIRVTPIQHFIITLLVTAFMASIGWLALSIGNEGFRKHALETQEDVAWRK